MGQHRSASASRLLGLDGLRSSPPVVAGGQGRLAVQTTATAVGREALTQCDQDVPLPGGQW